MLVQLQRRHVAAYRLPTSALRRAGVVAYLLRLGDASILHPRRGEVNEALFLDRRLAVLLDGVEDAASVMSSKVIVVHIDDGELEVIAECHGQGMRAAGDEHGVQRVDCSKGEVSGHEDGDAACTFARVGGEPSSEGRAKARSGVGQCLAGAVCFLYCRDVRSCQGVA